MALIKTEGASQTNQFTVPSRPAANNGTVYTVPAGKTFTGYFFMEYPANGSYTYIRVNGSDISVGANTTAGTWYAFPIYLSAGDVVSNYGTHYFTLTGREE